MIKADFGAGAGTISTYPPSGTDCAIVYSVTALPLGTAAAIYTFGTARTMQAPHSTGVFRCFPRRNR